MKFSRVIVFGVVAMATVGITAVGVNAMSPSPLQQAEQMFAQTSESLRLAMESEESLFKAHKAAQEVVETNIQLNNSYRCVIASLKQGQGQEVSDPDTIDICSLGK